MSRAKFDPSKAKGARQLDLFGTGSGKSKAMAGNNDGPISVSALTGLIKRALEERLPGRIMVAGEISNLKQHGSGHVYFSLKDADSQISAVMWKGRASKVRFELADGLAVIATGQVEVYGPQGKYQLMVTKLVPEGMGALELAFRQLKEKLATEGLFAASAKKELPTFPRTIALVTSQTGAAVRDMVRTLLRRYAALRILLYPVAVQGAGAAKQIADALGELDKQKEKLGGIDLIILGRGGGSLEDLWAFNEQMVARAIFACEIPIISAVGHETDVTIADMVADKRAATPTAGAELAVPVLTEVVENLLDSQRRLGRFIGQVVRLGRGRLDEVSARLAKAMSERLNETIQRTSQLERRLLRVGPAAALARATGQVNSARERLGRNMDLRIRRAERAVQHKTLALARWSPGQLIKIKKVHLQAATTRLSRAVQVAKNVQTKRLEATQARLRAVGPQMVLARGYSVTTDAATGELIGDAGSLSVGQAILTRLHKGQIESTVKSTRE